MNTLLMHMLPILLLLLTFASIRIQAQQSFARADSLRGTLSAIRSGYDVHYYQLDVTIDPATKSIRGSNRIVFSVTADLERMQLDLFRNMKIEGIVSGTGRRLEFEREYNAVFVVFPESIARGSIHEVTVSYSGTPQEATLPPWQGGFTWTNDSLGNPWIAVTCQGTGASLWWPTKDHQSDEPDSMSIIVTVPPGLQNISNGRLRSLTTLPGGWNRSEWFVSYPINTYNVTVNIGTYAHFAEQYSRDGTTLTLDYYVMPYNLEKARKQFQEVPLVLRSFEKYFGSYPFPRDGYKLVECPHLGMEHQSAIAYGNRFVNGYRGEAKSAVGPSSPIGLAFDFIIVHETAHEWWGNSITSADIADMWIHESFGSYAEALYVEDRWGYEEALTYVNAKKTSILNDRPIIGPYGVNKGGSKDMYNKGQIVLNTLRHVIANDSLWFSILHGVATTFRYKIVTTEDIVTYVNKRTGTDYTYFFEHYFREKEIPQLDAFISKKGERVTLRYKWNKVSDSFLMPVKVTTAPGTYSFIYPTTVAQTIELGPIDPMQFKVAEDLFYTDLKLGWTYIDPRKVD